MMPLVPLPRAAQRLRMTPQGTRNLLARINGLTKDSKGRLCADDKLVDEIQKAQLLLGLRRRGAFSDDSARMVPA